MAVTSTRAFAARAILPAVLCIAAPLSPHVFAAEQDGLWGPLKGGGQVVGMRRAPTAAPAGGVPAGRWCRSRETARLAFGKVEPWPALDSFFRDRSREPAQTAAVRARAAERPGAGNLILGTHQVNITALTGVFPAQGEVVVLTPQGNGTFRIAGRLPPPQRANAPEGRRAPRDRPAA